MTPENKALLEKYPQYYRDVSHLEVIDVYRILNLFGVTDPTAQHSIKKLLLSGQRTGGKPIEVDLKEARDTLSRGLAMRAEDANKGQLGFDFAAPGTTSVTILNKTGEPLPPLSDEVLKHIIGHGASLSMGTVAEKPAEYAMPEQARPLTDEERAALFAPAVRFCRYAGCEMRVRDENSDHCMIHSKPITLPPPPAPPAAPYMHKPWCQEKCAASACHCQVTQDPAMQLPNEPQSVPLHSGPGAPQRRTR